MRKEHAFPDLDALVLAEIESASEGDKHLRDEDISSAGREVSRVAVEEGGQAQQRDLAQIHGDNRAGNNISGEEAELLEHESTSDEQALDDLPPPKLFTPEEEAFMHRAVGFLSGRENGDVILGQIWERITENHPESFFEPSDGIAEAPTSTNNREVGEERDGGSSFGDQGQEP